MPTMKRFCRRCQQRREVDWKQPGTLDHCPPCLRALARGELTPAQAHEQKHGKKRSKNYRNRRTEENRAWANTFKKGLGCFYCPEDDPACLDFHHEDPSLKETEISQLLQSATLEEVKLEAAKCKVVCSNCHRKYHKRLREFGAPKPPVRIRAKDPLLEWQPNQPVGYAEAMAELRRKCFPDMEVEKKNTLLSDERVGSFAVVLPTSEQELKPPSIAKQRRALIVSLLRLDAEMCSHSEGTDEHEGLVQRRTVMLADLSKIEEELVRQPPKTQSLRVMVEKSGV